jgi:hypothetical protein
LEESPSIKINKFFKIYSLDNLMEYFKLLKINKEAVKFAYAMIMMQIIS